MMNRKVKKVVVGNQVQDGAGVKLTRVLASSTVEDFDPFLMFDVFDSRNPKDYTKGFPWHPHRGIETVTYVISGNVEHRDSLGNRGCIKNGACQWMTAGKGIIHQEMLKPVTRLLGFQLWVNMPQKNKLSNPAYRDIFPDVIPVVNEDGVEIKVISGAYKDVHAYLESEHVRADYLDVRLDPNTEWSINTEEKDTVFIYIVDGDVFISGQHYPSKRAVLFCEGDKVEINSGMRGARILYLTSTPLKEGVVWRGPIVMNTQEEVAEAYREFENGTFVEGFEVVSSVE